MQVLRTRDVTSLKPGADDLADDEAVTVSVRGALGFFAGAAGVMANDSPSRPVRTTRVIIVVVRRWHRLQAGRLPTPWWARLSEDGG